MNMGYLRGTTYIGDSISIRVHNGDGFGLARLDGST